MSDAILAATTQVPILERESVPASAEETLAPAEAGRASLEAPIAESKTNWMSEFIMDWVSMPTVLDGSSGLSFDQHVVGRVVGLNVLRLDTNSKRYRVMLEAGMPFVPSQTGAVLDASFAFRLGWNREF